MYNPFVVPDEILEGMTTRSRWSGPETEALRRYYRRFAEAGRVSELVTLLNEHFDRHWNLSAVYNKARRMGLSKKKDHVDREA